MADRKGDDVANLIRIHAYGIFESKACESGHDLDDWLEAERELIRKAPVELIEEDLAFKVRIAVPDVDSNHGERSGFLSSGEMCGEWRSDPSTRSPPCALRGDCVACLEPDSGRWMPDWARSAL
jgi:hypothetical protein